MLYFIYKQSMKIQLLNYRLGYKSRKKAFIAVFINCFLMSFNALQMK